jgi:glycosyltransferase involved in cell wall biosynthesis
MSAQQLTYKERMSALKCVVLMPTYNNAGTIAKVIADVKQYSEDVIVVNDGSTDDTKNILASIADIKVIDYPKNKGKGYALKLGLQKAYEWGYRYAITIDSDGQHYADDIPTFLDKIEEKPDSLLIGARNLAADNMPSKNTFANKFSNFWYKVETGKTLSDTQSGYRLYPLEKLQKIHFITRRYEFEVEIIVRAAWRGVNVENIPIKVYYPPVEERVSHFRPLQDFTRISILNTVLVLYAILVYYPWKFLRLFTIANIKSFINKQILLSKESNLKIAAAMGWGVLCGVLPIWGYQMAFAGVSAHFMKLNKMVAMAFSTFTIPPLIPFILYGSVLLGAKVLCIENVFTLDNISLESASQSVAQYIVGSVVLAIVLGLAVFILSLLVMFICKRKPKNE